MNDTNIWPLAIAALLMLGLLAAGWLIVRVARYVWAHRDAIAQWWTELSPAELFICVMTLVYLLDALGHKYGFFSTAEHDTPMIMGTFVGAFFAFRRVRKQKNLRWHRWRNGEVVLQQKRGEHEWVTVEETSER